MAAKTRDGVTDPALPEFRVTDPQGRIRWLQARAYPITDEQGRVQYTDTPCGESATSFRKQTTPAGPAATQDERMQKTQRLLDAMEAERNEEKRLAAEAKAEKEKRKRNCVLARDRYRRLTTASRLYDLDEQGNRVILNDAPVLDMEHVAMLWGHQASHGCCPQSGKIDRLVPITGFTASSLMLPWAIQKFTMRTYYSHFRS